MKRHSSLALLAASMLCSLSSAQITSYPYFEDFEAGPGGFAGGGMLSSWEWGIPSGPFIGSANDGLRAWVTNLDGTYNQQEQSYVESPVFDCSALTIDPTLQFSHIFQHDSSDESWVEMSLDAGPFVKLGAAGDPGSLNWYTNTFSDWWNGTSNVNREWQTARNKMTGAAGKMAQLRWRVSADSFVGEDGIGIDSVSVFETLVDVTPVGIESPASGASLSATELITVVIANLGTGTVTDVPVSCEVVGPVNASVSETFTVPIGAISDRPLTFATPFDFSIPGEYTITITTNVAADEIGGNNSIVRTVVNQGVVDAFPYVEDFESGSGGFIGAGVSSSWELGLPSASFISSASSGANAWVTNLDGSHATAEDSYLQSPTFDCRLLGNDPFVSFQHIFALGSSSEGDLKMSINGGPFLRVGSADDPASENWYSGGFSNSNVWEGTSGSSGVWRRASHILPGAAGNFVQLRWSLFPDFSSFLSEGMGVDDVRVFEAPFGSGQRPQPGRATLNVTGASDVVGFPTSEGVPGPYYASVSASNDTLDISITGAANQPVVLLWGDLEVGARPLGAIGTIDLANGFSIFASGGAPGPLNQFFNTNFDGDMSISLSVPLSFVGVSSTLQAAVFDPIDRFYVSNAVQVTFLP